MKPALKPAPARRTRTISAKVTEPQYDLLAAMAGDEGLSEWMRQILLSAASPRPVDQLLLAEVLALRTIVVNLQFSVATGEPVNVQSMQRLIDHVDENKLQKARELLAATVRRRA